MTRLGQQSALDGVRAVAIGLVVLRHVEDVLSPGSRFFPGGFLGVDVFFVLSGFLITRLLLEERDASGGISLRRFWGRRASRLLPALVVFVLGHVAWVVLTDQPIAAGDEAKSLGFILLYVGNWSHHFGSGLLQGVGHLWSLSVEEQFYVVWPIVVVAIGRRPDRLRIAIGGGILVAVVLRIALWTEADSWIMIYSRTDARMDALLIGAGLGLAHASGALAKVPAAARRWAALAGLLWIVGAVLHFDVDDRGLFYGHFTLVAIASAAVVAGVVDQRWWMTDLLSARVPRAVGRVSYGLYLWHLLVLLWVADLLPGRPKVVVVAVAVLATAAAVAASWRFVEQPVLAWGHRRFARPTGPPAEQPASTA